MESYWTIKTSGFSEVVEKKSRFLGEVHHARDEAEALAYLQAAKKKYYDARHHCSAYLVGTAGQAQEMTKANDDGEPGGSAGRPMLEVLTNANLHECIAIVTRYFGGTLLGTGGLVRAYTLSVQEALKHATLVERLRGEEIQLRLSYADAGKLTYYFEEQKYPLTSTYEEDVLLTVNVPRADVATVLAQITERTDGRAVTEGRTEIIFER